MIWRFGGSFRNELCLAIIVNRSFGVYVTRWRGMTV